MERPPAPPAPAAPASTSAHAADVERMWAVRDARLKADAQAAWPVKVAR